MYHKGADGGVSWLGWFGGGWRARAFFPIRPAAPMANGKRIIAAARLSIKPGTHCRATPPGMQTKMEMLTI